MKKIKTLFLTPNNILPSKERYQQINRKYKKLIYFRMNPQNGLTLPSLIS